MISKVVTGVLVVIVIFLGYVALQPPGYKVTRKITINKPAEAIFPHINNSKLTENWAPWTEVDPQVKMNYSGPEDGVGAVTSWDSPGQMGTGSATVIETITNELVRTKLEYTKPYAMNQEALMTITPLGTESVVTWSVKGENNFLGRLACTFFDMDKMVGGNFEKGLTKLKSIVESAPQQLK